MNNLKAAVNSLETEIEGLLSQGQTFTFSLNQRPRLHIHNLSPLVYDRYGFVRNRGPMIVGKVVLETLLTSTSPDEDTGQVYLGVRAGEELYGFTADVTTLNSIANLVGRPDLATFKVASSV